MDGFCSTEVWIGDEEAFLTKELAFDQGVGYKTGTAD
jgi:hypothetical protein